VSVTISDSVADELFVGSDDGSTNFFAGDICDVRVASVGTWYLNDHPAGSLDGLPAFDSSGNGNDGVHVGGTSIVGEGAPVPQTALQDWNEYYRPLNEVAASGWTWDFATGTFTLTATGAIARGFSITPGISGNVVRITGNATVNDESPLFSLRTGTISGTVNSNLSGPIGTGEFEITLTATGSYEYLTISEGDFPATFTVENLRIYLPAGNYYVPEASDNPGFDVLGNAIANPRGELLNPRGETGDSITILEDATLGAMKTWAMIVNYDGEDQTLLDLGTPEITVASDTIATSGITSPTIYVDGVATTTLTTGRHLVVVTTETATDCGPITCSNLIQNGKDVGYDTNPLSASGVAQLYRALRRYL
jgi:hypothetical protein